MSLADRHKWDKRYRDGTYAGRRHPAVLVERFASRLEPGRALDIACGAGRNSLYLAEAGFAVDAVDISSEALARLRADAGERQLTIRTHAADLEHGLPESPPLENAYDLIIMIRYVNQSLIGPLLEILAPDGILVAEQHVRTDQDVVGPKSQAYRLAPNELLDTARQLRVHYYREAIVPDPDGRRAALAQLVASHAESAVLLD